MGTVYVVAVRHRLHRTSLSMITSIIFHIHAGHTAVVLVLMGGTFASIVLCIGLRIGLRSVLKGRLRLQLADGRRPAKQQ